LLLGHAEDLLGRGAMRGRDDASFSPHAPSSQLMGVVRGTISVADRD